jgi:hypothetical protein
MTIIEQLQELRQWHQVQCYAAKDRDREALKFHGRAVGHAELRDRCTEEEEKLIDEIRFRLEER